MYSPWGLNTVDETFEMRRQIDALQRQVQEFANQKYSMQCANLYSPYEGLVQADTLNGYNPWRSDPYPHTYDPWMGDPYSNPHNPGWRSHSNFSWQNNEGQPQGQVFNETYEAPKDEKFDQLLQAFQQYATSTTSAIRRIEIQVQQIAEAQAEEEAQREATQHEWEVQMEEAHPKDAYIKEAQPKGAQPEDNVDPEEDAHVLTHAQGMNRSLVHITENFTSDVLENGKSEFTPSEVVPFELELAPLPAHAYLPIVIFAELTPLQDKVANPGWTLADPVQNDVPAQDTKGINPDVRKHETLLEDNAKPSRDTHRWLDPNLTEVVRAKCQFIVRHGTALGNAGFYRRFLKVFLKA